MEASSVRQCHLGPTQPLASGSHTTAEFHRFGQAFGRASHASKFKLARALGLETIGLVPPLDVVPELGYGGRRQRTHWGRQDGIVVGTLNGSRRLATSAVWRRSVFYSAVRRRLGPARHQG